MDIRGDRDLVVFSLPTKEQKQACGREERSGISKYLELRPNKPVKIMGHRKDIFIEVFGEEAGLQRKDK